MSAKSDPGRSLALLWGSHTRPGRSGLTVRAIVTAAIELADAEGMDAATMRRVAERLGSGTMSLYTHVPGKTELADLMVDTVLGELYTGVDDPAGHGGWREGMRYVAERNWDVSLRHPWLLDATGGRPTLGPNAVAKYEAELRVLEGIGLSDVQMDSVLALVLTHVEGVARSHAGLARAQRDSGMSEQEWWRSTAPVLERVMEGHEFPLASRVGEASSEVYQASTDPAYAFAFGLDVILDGVQRLIEK
ncbi:TetR/AcrR family transcriptional regulator [Catellatospora sp. NPDC049609]|uniref:TetR/AcrR family transcriptional regulator n=1 Tax=Catellatospora sp. NPDC049609 TaxID=3155505 RepID=UPI0034409948